MMTWTKGRMEFVCTEPAEEGKREERWLGEVKVRSYGPGAISSRDTKCSIQK
ncbi:hypothetical protein [Petralouisia muris]|uniref:hypothetical protein n=1 Tax=Petralouisia muris TaxID=3032872 RepID=UPI0014411A68|nr:hypothetical protein [Petralouisia muris]